MNLHAQEFPMSLGLILQNNEQFLHTLGVAGEKDQISHLEVSGWNPETVVKVRMVYQRDKEEVQVTAV